jgi:uncharacterized membrane protein HdeD (DUF308 family)
MSAQSLVDETKKRAAWSILMGVLTAALGSFLIVYPLATAKFTTVVLGWVLIIVGIAQFVYALHSQKPGSFFPKLLSAGIFGIIGVTFAFAPMAGVEGLTGLLGTLLLVQAGLATVTAFQSRPLAGWGWFLLEAGISFVLGMLILIKWPTSSVWAIGTLVGVAVLMGGIVRIIVAAKIWSGAGSVKPLCSRDVGMSSEPPNTQRSGS